MRWLQHPDLPLLALVVGLAALEWLTFGRVFP